MLGSVPSISSCAVFKKTCDPGEPLPATVENAVLVTRCQPRYVYSYIIPILFNWAYSQVSMLQMLQPTFGKCDGKCRGASALQRP